MYTCRRCVLRCLDAVVSDHVYLRSSARSRYASPAFSPQRSCRHGSLLAAQPVRDSPSIASSLGESSKKDDTQSVTLEAANRRQRRALDNELKYLTDSVKLAEHVHYTLQCDKPEKALDLCRKASKRQEAVVSWNHCIDWHMNRGSINIAIKIYNEMKKRAQFPDSHTYTLLLRGLARLHTGQKDMKENVTRAMTIYNSLSSPTSRVRPNIKHTNAALQVCSVASDMDAMWSIVSQLPQKGQGAAEHVTFTTILNAIRHGAFGTDGSDSGTYIGQIAARRREAVRQGRVLWHQIIAKWTSGEIQIDEGLVCAMGRLLLISKHMRDWDDVFSLVEQTMNIERQIPPIGSPDRHTEHVPLDNAAAQADAEAEDAKDYGDTLPAKVFSPLNLTTKTARDSGRMSAQPGNPTLSLLVTACEMLRIPKTAAAYWACLTRSITDGGWGVKPDIRNFNSQLRLLSVNRSSSKAASLMKQIIGGAVLRPDQHTFRDAMTVCVRDMKNPHVLEHASDIVDVMEQTSSEPCLQTLQSYLFLAVRTEKGPPIVSVLDHLDSSIHNLRSKVVYGSEEVTSKSSAAMDVDGTLKFFQAVVGAIDTLMKDALVPREDFKHWTGRRNQLISFLGRARYNLDKQFSQLQSKTPLSERFPSSRVEV